MDCQVTDCDLPECAETKPYRPPEEPIDAAGLDAACAAAMKHRLLPRKITWSQHHGWTVEFA